MADDNSAAWTQAAQAINSAAGMAYQSGAGKQTFKRNKEMMAIQFKNQQALNEQGQDLQMKTWKETGAPAQMAMLREAGLNPALMYGMSGAGGATTGSQGGGSASGGSTPNQPMDIGGAVQLGMMQAQMKVMESQAAKNEAEAESIRGGEGTTGEAQIQSLKAGIEKMKAETEHEAVKKTLTQAQKYLTDMNFDIATQDSIIRSMEKGMMYDTYWDQIDGIKAVVASQMLDKELKESKVQLNEAQRKAAIEGITQRWWEIGVKGVGTIVNGVLGKGIISKMGEKGNGGPGQWRKNE